MEAFGNGMQIGVTTSCYYGLLETEDALERVAALGVRVCEAFLQTRSEYEPGFARALRRKLDALGLSAVSVHPRGLQFEGDLLGRSPRQRADAFAVLRRVLDAGQTLGAKVYVHHGAPVIRGMERDMVPWLAPLGEAVQLAEARGVTLCWETVSWCALNSPRRVAQARRLWPGMGFVLDVKQCLETGYDPLEFLAEMGGQIRHVHALDTDGHGGYFLPGQRADGYDFTQLADALKAQGYRGGVILEPYVQQAMDDDAMKASIAYLRKLFES